MIVDINAIVLSSVMEMEKMDYIVISSNIIYCSFITY